MSFLYTILYLVHLSKIKDQVRWVCGVFLPFVLLIGGEGTVSRGVVLAGVLSWRVSSLNQDRKLSLNLSSQNLSAQPSAVMRWGQLECTHHILGLSHHLMRQVKQAKDCAFCYSFSHEGHGISPPFNIKWWDDLRMGVQVHNSFIANSTEYKPTH